MRGLCRTTPRGCGAAFVAAGTSSSSGIMGHFPPSGSGALPSQKKPCFPLQEELCHLSLPGVFPLTLRALFGVPWPAPSTREAAAYAVSLSLSRSRPGAAGPRSIGGRYCGFSRAAAMSALAKASGALKSVDYEVFGRVQGNGRLRGAGGRGAPR